MIELVGSKKEGLLLSDFEVLCFDVGGFVRCVAGCVIV